MIYRFAKYIFLTSVILAVAACSAWSQANSKHVKVKGYYRKNGTYVRPHYRTAPNSTNRDNFSTRGNTNPYTGKKGWIRPDNSHPSTSNRQSSVQKRRKRYTDTGTSVVDKPKKVGKYPNGYVYATTKSNGQLWQKPSQIDVARSIPKNSFVRVLNYKGEFWEVVYDGTIGYVHSVTIDVNSDMLPLKTKIREHYTAATRSNNNTAATSIAYSIKQKRGEIEYASWSTVQSGKCTLSSRKSLTDYYFVVKTAYLNNAPTDQSKPVSKLNFGDKVNVICSEGKWYEIVHKDRTGWIEKRLLRK